MLPAGSTITGVQVSTNNKTTFSGNYLIRPVQPPCVIGQVCDTVAPNPAIYNSNNPYPESQIKVLADRYIFGYHVITMQVTPFEYIPASRQLSLYQQLDIQILYTQGNIAQTVSSSQKIEKSNFDFIKAMVVNPQDLNVMRRPVITNLPIPTTEARKQVLHWQPDSTGDQPEYVIVTNNALKPYFQTFANYKTKRGIPTVIATVEDIYQNYTGVDHQEQIRNYLKDVYSKWGTVYVLLGGDTDIIPARIGTLEIFNGYHYWITDLYYSDVYNPNDPNNNWNANGNSNFGWEDDDNIIYLNGTYTRYLEYVPDNYLGRISVHNENDVINIISKIQKYESLNGISSSYVNNLLLVGAYGVLGTNSDLNRGQYWMDRLFNKSYLSTKNKWRLYDEHLTSTHNPYLGDEELSRDSLLYRLSNGGNNGYFHIISHFDHGNPYSIGASSLMKGDLMYKSDCNSLQNLDYLQIMYTAACEPGQFDKDSFAEQYINASNTAGIAIYANTGFGWQGNYIQQDYLFEAMYLNSINRLGNISNFVKVNNQGYHSNYNKNFTLFGDPTMMVWTNTPGNIVLTTPQDFTIDNNSNNELTVQLNSISSDAVVTLYKFNNTTQNIEVYAAQEVPAFQTNAVFYIQPDTEGPLLITATAKNYLPATAITNIHLPQAHVYITHVNYTDSNGNNAIEPGETISLEFELTNSGNTDISNISAHLRPDNALLNQITILQADNTYNGTITSGNSVTLDNYQFQYNNTTGEMPYFLKFWLDITDANGYSHSDEFYLDLEQTGLELGMRYVTDANGNIMTDMSGLQTGETYHLHIALNNIANIDATGINGTLSSSDASINITQNQSAYPDIGAHHRQLNTTDFEFELSQVPNGSLPFNLQVTNALGVQQDFSFDLIENPIPQIDGFHFTSTADEIKLMWNPVSNIKGYNVYRADTNSSNPDDYIKVNDRLLEGSSMYVNIDLQPTTNYYYKISVVSSSGNELPLQLLHTAIDYNNGNQLNAYKAWTSFSFHTGFPIYHTLNGPFNSSPTVADINGDGKREIFIAKNDWRKDGDETQMTEKGVILGYDEQGHELFNIDGNTTELQGFAHPPFDMRYKVAVMDIDGDGQAEVFGMSRQNSPAEARLYAYHTVDTHPDNHDRPDHLWDTYNTANGDWEENNYINISINSSNHRAFKAPVMADINNDGISEIIVLDEHQSIHVYDKDANIIYEYNVNNYSGYSETEVAVGDIDGDGFKDIVFNIQDNSGNGDGAVYYCSPHTQNLPVLIKEFLGQENGSGKLVLADIDGDNKKEIVTATSGSNSKLYALNVDGSPVTGWNTNGISIPDISSGGISVGDLDNDGNLEIIIAASNQVIVYNNQGMQKANVFVEGVCKKEAILADVEGNNSVDVVVNIGNSLNAYYYTGNSLIMCNGWPIYALDDKFSGSPYIGDIDADSLNEIVITDKGSGAILCAWDTSGNADKIEWGSARYNAQNTACYSKIDDLDLTVKDGIDDPGTEPNNVTQHLWTSSDIWIRNHDDNGTEHENPEYDPNNPVYVYVRVINRSNVASTGNELLHLYWGKARLDLFWPQPWTGYNDPQTGVRMGDEIIRQPNNKIPILQPGESRIIKFPWHIPNPENYVGIDPNPWHYCLLARIESANDPMTYPETTDLVQNVKNNNNIAWKNVTVVNVVPNQSDIALIGTVAIGNMKDESKMYYLELIKDPDETGNPIFKEAEVKLKMSEALYTAWERGGKIAEELKATSDEKVKFVKGNNVILDNIAFNPNEMGTLTLTFNFLTEKMTDKDKFTYHLIQHDYQTGEIIGGETFVIKKQPRPSFLAIADNKEADKGDIVTLSAVNINEAAEYNWYDEEGNLIYQGKDLSVSVDMAKKYKLEVIATSDGFKDYKEVEVKLKPNRIESLSPNPASQQVNVTYKINEGNAAYIMLINISGNNNAVGNYVVDVTEDNYTIDLSGYPTGVYSVVLVTEGQITDIKELLVE